MTNQTIDILIPTFNNPEQLYACVQSIARNYLLYPMRVIIINNGASEVTKDPAFESPYIDVLYPTHNLGWEGALKLGLEHSSSEYVVFMNDDTVVPEAHSDWLNQLLQNFRDPVTGAVGPSSNVVMGSQNIFFDHGPRHVSRCYLAPFLIGFCVMFRRSALDEIGGVDDALPGGDDLDFSIRLRQAGYNLLIDHNVFIYHHGFQTGTRVYGGHEKPGGWNSAEMTENTNMALIKKHGLKTWHQAFYDSGSETIDGPELEPDSEGKLIISYIKESDTVVDLGCGANKTVPQAIGVDEVAGGQPIPMLADGHNISQADVVANVAEKLPFRNETFDVLIARHILEHISDPIKTLREWRRIVKKGGKLLIAVPNQEECTVIPLNPEHLHAWNVESFRSLAELMGFKVVDIKSGYNGVSLTAILETL